MNFVDEQSGERCHKRHKFSRPHLSRKTSAVDNLEDMVRAALCWSDPKMAYLTYQSSCRRNHKPIDEEFESEMAEFFDLEETLLGNKFLGHPYDNVSGDCTNSDEEDTDGNYDYSDDDEDYSNVNYN